MNHVKRILSALHIRPYPVAVLTALSIVGAVLEGAGVSLLYPVLQFVEKGPGIFQEAHQGRAWALLLGIMHTLRLPLNLLTLLALCLLPILVRQVFYFLNLVYIARVQNRAVARLQSEVFARIVDADLAFFEGTSRGKLTNTLLIETGRAGQLVNIVFQFVTTVVMLVAYLGCLCYISWVLTAMALLSFAFVQLLIHRHVSVAGKYGKQITEQNEHFGHLVGEKVSAVRLIKLHHTQREETGFFQRTAMDLAQSTVEFHKRGVIVQVTVEPTLIFGAFAVLYLAVTFLQMNLAVVSLFIFILLRMLPLAKQANLCLQNVKGYTPSLENVSGVLAKAARQQGPSGGGRPFTQLRDGIRLEHVGFRYGKGAPVLRDITITIPAGKTTAIVGHSGGGKSTLADCLLRLREIQEGEIYFDDVPLRTLDMGDFRRSVACVSQDAILLNDTVARNLAYGLPGVRPEAMIQALTMSHAWEFVRLLPHGLETVLGDRGLKLSGGERQRLCLARALLRKPTVLILDEPTSSLDAESERYIQETIQAVRKELTLIVIAHRFSTIRDADQILVVENGTIDEVGSHEELLSNSLLYNRLFKLQLQP